MQRVKRVAGIWNRVCLVGASVLASSCSGGSSSLAYQFDDDYVEVEAKPGVVAADDEAQQTASVKPDSLEFPADTASDVRDWQAGRIVVAGPSTNGTGVNPLGFARRVVSVEEAGEKIVVHTQPVGLYDLFEGELQVRLDQYAEPIDLTQLDPQVLNDLSTYLYTAGDDLDIILPNAFELLRDNAPEPDKEIASVFDFPGSRTGATAAVYNAASPLVDSVIANAAAPVSLVTADKIIAEAVDPEGSIRIQRNLPLFTNAYFEKSFTSADETLTADLFIGGSASVIADITIKPEFQFGLRLPDATSEQPLEMWTTIASVVDYVLVLDLQLTAGTSKATQGTITYVDDVLQSVRNRVGEGTQIRPLEKLHLLGNQEFKPTGKFRKTLFLSKPKVLQLKAGEVPLVLTYTYQVDLMCGFEAKGGINTGVGYHGHSELFFTASVRDEETLTASVSEPRHLAHGTSESFVHSAGAANISCSIVPRINAAFYDAISINVGVRHSFDANVAYQADCRGDGTIPPVSTTTTTVKPSTGIQVGARFAPPGVTALDGVIPRAHLGVVELWQQTSDSTEYTSRFEDDGYGYCTATCNNEKKDGLETDIDCGGYCSTCYIDEACRVNTDCDPGLNCVDNICKPSSHCFNGVADKLITLVDVPDFPIPQQDWAESGVDCGGKCAPCSNQLSAFARTCYKNSDCESNSCQVKDNWLPGAKRGQDGKFILGTCNIDPCDNGRKDGDEGGIDCGGRCAKCTTGTKVTSSDHCVSGIVRVTKLFRKTLYLTCVDSVCENGKVDGNETDKDCGGDSECRRCGALQKCQADSDCQGGLVCDEFFPVCLDAPASCTDRLKNQDETGIDCGGTKCTACDIGGGCTTSSDCANSAPCGAVSKTCETTIGGTASALPGPVTLNLSATYGTPPTNVVDQVVVPEQGIFTFTKTLPEHAVFAVAIDTVPPGYSCQVSNATGIMPAQPFTEIGLTCAKQSFTVGGSVSGLSGQLVVQLNGGSDLTITASGLYTFSTLVDFDDGYDVSILSSPPGQSCTVTDGTGVMGASNVTNANIACTTDTYSIGGTISGLQGSVTLRLEGIQVVVYNSNGAFAFPSLINYGASYTVTVDSQSPGQTCAVTNGSGTVGANVTDVVVTCTPLTYAVLANVSGLNLGETLVLQNNASDNLSIPWSGLHSFSTAVAFGSAYDVTVQTQPTGKTCTVTSGSGTMGTSAVTATVACAANSYTVGGMVSGLNGTVVLQQSGGDDISIAADGGFVFPTAVTFGAGYTVTVLTQPATQTCSVTNGSGTMGAGNITNVMVTCATNTHTIGGTVTGLSGTVVLQNNAGDDLSVSTNGSFTFATPITLGAAYAVTVLTQPQTSFCTISSGSGTVNGDVNTVAVTCSGAAPKTVFITSTDHQGNLGGIAGADSICQARADAASRAGTYLAWISDNSTSPAARFSQSTTPYVLVNGNTIANDWADLTDGELQRAIDVDENNATKVSVVWSGADLNGSGLNDVNCLSWNSSSSGQTGNVGSAAATMAGWTRAGGDFCNNSFALYCFQQ